jgi:hypothetical protein
VAALRTGMGLPDQAAAREEKRNRAFDRLVNRPPRRYCTYGEQI